MTEPQRDFFELHDGVWVGEYTKLRLVAVTPSSEALWEAVEEIRQVASGELQVAADDTEGMAWIDKRAQTALATSEPAQPTVDHLAQHWLSQMVCDHPGKQDRAVCCCGFVTRWAATVGGAAKLWAEHVLGSAVRAALRGSGEAPPSEREKELERVLHKAHFESGCDGDLCTHSWHEEAARLLGDKAYDRPAAVGSWQAGAAQPKDNYTNYEVQELLVRQRRELGAQYDTLNEELNRVRKVAAEEIERLLAPGAAPRSGRGK